MSIQRAGFPFIALGVVFVALGASTGRAFLAIGIAFIVLGFILLMRRRQ